MGAQRGSITAAGMLLDEVGDECRLQDGSRKKLTELSEGELPEPKKIIAVKVSAPVIKHRRADDEI
jgi:hypothetical protein